MINLWRMAVTITPSATLRPSDVTAYLNVLMGRMRSSVVWEMILAAMSVVISSMTAHSLNARAVCLSVTVIGIALMEAMK